MSVCIICIQYPICMYTYICAIQKCILVTAKKQITNNGHPITTAGHNYYMLSYMLGFQPNVFPRCPGPGMNIQHDDINMWSSYPYLQIMRLVRVLGTQTQRLKEYKYNLYMFMYNLYANIDTYLEKLHPCIFWKPHIHQKSTEDMLRTSDDFSNPFPRSEIGRWFSSPTEAPDYSTRLVSPKLEVFKSLRVSYSISKPLMRLPKLGRKNHKTKQKTLTIDYRLW